MLSKSSVLEILSSKVFFCIKHCPYFCLLYLLSILFVYICATKHYITGAILLHIKTDKELKHPCACLQLLCSLTLPRVRTHLYVGAHHSSHKPVHGFMHGNGINCRYQNWMTSETAFVDFHAPTPPLPLSHTPPGVHHNSGHRSPTQVTQQVAKTPVTLQGCLTTIEAASRRTQDTNSPH